MGVIGKSPRSGDEIGPWMHDKVSGGKERSGWIAGHVHEFAVHSSRATKPCTRFYCGDMVDCVGCRDKVPVKALGYVPLYRWDGRPVIVIIQQHHFEQVGELPIHSYVMWGRAEGRGEGVYIKPGMVDRKWETTIPAKRCPASIIKACCVLWRMPEMETVLRDCMGGSDNGLSTTTPLTPRALADEVAGIKKDAGERITKAVKRSFVVKPTDPAPISELLPNLHAKAMNGKV